MTILGVGVLVDAGSSLADQQVSDYYSSGLNEAEVSSVSTIRQGYIFTAIAPYEDKSFAVVGEELKASVCDQLSIIRLGDRMRIVMKRRDDDKLVLGPTEAIAMFRILSRHSLQRVFTFTKERTSLRSVITSIRIPPTQLKRAMELVNEFPSKYTIVTSRPMTRIF
jgi:hypothetical protein